MKMIWIFLVVPLTLCISNSEVLGQEPDDGLSKVLTELKSLYNVLKLKCKKVGGNDLYRTIEHVENGNPLCSLSMVESFDDFCSKGRNRTKNCLKQYTDLAAKCAEPKEKYLPEFFVKTETRMFDHICSPAFMDDLNSATNVTCGYLPAAAFIQETAFKKCPLELKILTDYKKPGFALTKDLVCGDLHILYECVVKELRGTCPQTEVPIAVVNSTMALFWADCSKGTSPQVAWWLFLGFMLAFLFS